MFFYIFILEIRLIGVRAAINSCIHLKIQQNTMKYRSIQSLFRMRGEWPSGLYRVAFHVLVIIINLVVGIEHL